MINFNGVITNDAKQLSVNNRAYAYGDGLFETIRYSNGSLLFWEDHYFRLMASMRILRMEIPMNFTMEFLQEEIENLLQKKQIQKTAAKVRLSVFREEGGLYTPNVNTVQYLIQAETLDSEFYTIEEGDYEVDLFKDHYVTPGLLSSLKTNNKIINVLGSIYAKENKLANCLLLNTNKQVIEALNGNLFVVKGNHIKTAPLVDGCLRGIMRKQLIDILLVAKDYEFEEAPISPFELQKADELFISNVITGIQPISKYRKKIYESKVGRQLLGRLNTKIRLQ
jgi:branched-chain amino acid aminotransferase